jgi:hypothetical protein
LRTFGCNLLRFSFIFKYIEFITRLGSSIQSLTLKLALKVLLFECFDLSRQTSLSLFHYVVRQYIISNFKRPCLYHNCRYVSSSFVKKCFNNRPEALLFLVCFQIQKLRF